MLRKSMMLIFLFMIFISNCSANSSQGRLLNIGVEMFKKQIIANSNFKVGRYLSPEFYLYHKDIVDLQIELYGNVYVHPFMINSIILIDPMTNADGYIECIEIIGRGGRTDQFMLNQTAVKIAQIIGLSVEEMKILFLQGQEFRELYEGQVSCAFYLGQVYSAQLGKNIYLERMANKKGAFYIIDYKKPEERSSTLGKMFKL